MAIRYILPALAAVFLIAALTRIKRTGSRSDPAARTWLIIAAIFSAVSGWLWLAV